MIDPVMRKPPKPSGEGSADPSPTAPRRAPKTPRGATPKVTTWQGAEEESTARRQTGVPEAATRPGYEAPVTAPRKPVRPNWIRYGVEFGAPKIFGGKGYQAKIDPKVFDKYRLPSATLPALEGRLPKSIPFIGGKRVGGAKIGGMNATSFLQTAQAFGNPNPLAVGKTTLAVTTAMSSLMMLLQGYQDEEASTAYRKALIDYGYPEDAIDSMKFSGEIAGSIAGGAASIGTYAAQDFAVSAAGAGVGGVIGAFGGPAGVAGGAAMGWAAGAIVAGVSNILNMVEIGTPFVAKLANNILGTSWDGGLPTIDDLWRTQSSEFNGSIYMSAQRIADEFVLSAGGDRFYAPTEVEKEREKIINGYYALSVDVDPRAQEMNDLVGQGYFVKKNTDGTYGLDITRYQEYMLKTALYKKPEDKQKFLPVITADGSSFASTPLTESIWNQLWSNSQ
jgi:hypothetical protein